MPEQVQDWTQETVLVDGTGLVVIRGGKGRPLLVQHEELGHPGWLKWHRDLARDNQVDAAHDGCGYILSSANGGPSPQFSLTVCR